jgi:hypothetical protein
LAPHEVASLDIPNRRSRMFTFTATPVREPFGLSWRLLWRTTVVWTAVVVVARQMRGYRSAYPTGPVARSW